MKRTLLLILIFLPMLASAQNAVEIDGIYYNLKTEEKTAEVTQGPYQYYKGDVTIPESVTYDDVVYNVTSIGELAFSECRGLISITIPDGVTLIGESAFDHCSGLTSVAIPNSVTSIGEIAFSYCRGLTSVTIPNSVTSIGELAFSYCSSLTSIKVEAENTKYDSRDNCNAIIETESNTLIAGCQKTTIPNSVTAIGEYAFYGCDGLTSVIIPNGVTSIGDFAFYDCIDLTSVTIPNGTTSIGDYAFQYCSGLTSIAIGNGVTSIGKNAFIGCSGLISIDIPEGVTSIGDCAFLGCSGLTSITIPNSVISISRETFSGCSGLTSITIPGSVNSIGFGAFAGCSGLTSITIPNSVIEIGSYAFSQCSSLSSVTIPNSMTSIGSGAFYDCSALTSITIPEGITSIGSGAFYDCSALTSITIPEGITSIGNNTFAGCSGLTSITIPDGMTSIGESAFEGCSGLTSITIPNSVTTIGKYAIKCCSGLTSITIPNGVTSIDEATFYECSGLTSITIPGNVTTIGQWAFYGCSNLLDMFCYAENVPNTGNNVFNRSNIANATLHVPAASMDAYKAAEPWKQFKEIVALPDQGDETDNFNYIPFVKDGKGKRWHVVRSELNSSHTEQYMLAYEEVVKDGKTYLKMCRSMGDRTEIQDVGLFREEDRKVYFIAPDMQEEHLMFDFSLKEGDTYETYSYDEEKVVSYEVVSVEDYLEGPEYIHYIEKEDGLITQHRYLRKWTVCRTDDKSIKVWIEGVGSIEGPLGNRHDVVLPGLTKDYLAYVEDAYAEDPDYDNLYLPFTINDVYGHVHGCDLPTGAKDNEGSDDSHHHLTYEMEGDRLHVYGKVITQCGPNNYAYFIEKETDDQSVHKIEFEIEEVEPTMDCTALHATDFYVSGFDPNLNYIVVDNQGVEHQVINKTQQMAYRPFVEDGKGWKVGYGSDNPIQFVEYYYFDSDTIIDGKVCKQMMCQRYVSPDYPEYDAVSQQPSLRYVGAWYEEDKKVYFCNATDQQFKLMYDFSLEDNGTFQINDLPLYVVGPRQTGGMKGFKGVYRDVMMLWDGEQIYNTTWLEGVGNIDGPIYSVYLGKEGHALFLMSCTVGDEVIYLNDEYEDGATPTEARKRRFDFTHTIKTQPKARIKQEESDACINSSERDVARPKVKSRMRNGAEESMYGEYNDQQLCINLAPLDDTYLVCITDESGKPVYKKEINAGNIVGLNIDISNYSEGRYTVTVENSGESFTGEFGAQMTGIKEVSRKQEVLKDHIYNLQGQRINTLQKGLNIVNGQKVFVK